MIKTYLISLSCVIFSKIINILVSRLTSLFVKDLLHYYLWFSQIFVWYSNHKNSSAEIILKVVAFTIFSSVNHEKYCPFVCFACITIVLYCDFWLSFVSFFLKAQPLVYESPSIFHFGPYFKAFFLHLVVRKYY